MNSSRKIHYSLRVSKNIERKMIRDVLQRMGVFFPLEQYKYVGFGARYFTDFLLFHKYLHIEDMVSLEGDTSNKDRYVFNKPLDCIDLKFGMSNIELPKLKFDKKTIFWLDYDGVLNFDALQDIATIVRKAGSGTVLLLSYNSRPKNKRELEEKFPDAKEMERPKLFLEENFQADFIPYDFNHKGFSRWPNYSTILRKIIINCIKSNLNIANEKLDSNHLNYKQLFNFNYKDNAEMSTIGVIFYADSDQNLINRCDFERFDFCSSDESIYEIQVPNLTTKETKYLVEKMPLSSTNQKNIESFFLKNEIEQFSKIYKYMPDLRDSELT